jgi:hypothetical protein
MSSPVAKGSKVPAWPTFITLVKLRTFLTISKEVQPMGLSINNTLPSKKGISASGIGFCFIEFENFLEEFFRET